MAETNEGPLGHERRALPVGTRVQEFEVLQLIGGGGFGIVYLAEDTSLSRRVALKEYMPPMASRILGATQVSVSFAPDEEAFEAGKRGFLKEARLLARFDHPALVKVYRFWEENGTAYMVMPYYEGPTLQRAVLDNSFPADESSLRELLASLLDALASLHDDQVYHRDIAPDNILLTANGPVLLDFGAARAALGSGSQNFTVVLKEGYAPAEQYATDGAMAMRQGPWTDIYALASVVRYVLTGNKPLSAVARVASRVDPQEPVAQAAAGRCSETFLKAIDKAMALYAEERPQSIAEFRALLSGQGMPATAPPVHRQPTPLPSPAPPPRNAVQALKEAWERALSTALAPPWEPKAVAAAGVLALLASAVVVYRARSQVRPPEARPAQAQMVRVEAPPKVSSSSSSTAVSSQAGPESTEAPPSHSAVHADAPTDLSPLVNEVHSSEAAQAQGPAAAQTGAAASSQSQAPAPRPKEAALPPKAPVKKPPVVREVHGGKPGAHESSSSSPSASASSSAATVAAVPPPPVPGPDSDFRVEGDPGPGLESGGASGSSQAGGPASTTPDPPLTAEEMAYTLAVYKIILQNNHVPASPEYETAKLKGQAAVVSFELDRSGTVSQVFVDRPSGSPTLDKLAISIVSHGHYPAFPQGVWPGKARRVFTRTFVFK